MLVSKMGKRQILSLTRRGCERGKNQILEGFFFSDSVPDKCTLQRSIASVRPRETASSGAVGSSGAIGQSRDTR